MKKNTSLLAILCLTLSVLFSLCGCSVLDMTIEIGGSVLSEIGGLIPVSPTGETSSEPAPEITVDTETLESIRRAAGDYGYRYLDTLSHPIQRKTFYDSLKEECELFHDGDSDAGYEMSCKSNESFYRSEIDDLKNLGVTLKRAKYFIT